VRKFTTANSLCTKSAARPVGKFNAVFPPWRVRSGAGSVIDVLLAVRSKTDTEAFAGLDVLFTTNSSLCNESTAMSKCWPKSPWRASVPIALMKEAFPLAVLG
jgi:hypothetical protein